VLLQRPVGGAEDWDFKKQAKDEVVIVTDAKLNCICIT
jgi:hypothetical protein